MLFILGVYYIYAQVNYLDEHDVNAFQVLANEDPFLLCTVMTHTGRSHTISKANTCYTGMVFLHFSSPCIILNVVNYPLLAHECINNIFLHNILGGVMFLEADDEIYIRDLEVGRHSVVRPAHTFFGLIQLSGLDV